MQACPQISTGTLSELDSPVTPPSLLEERVFREGEKRTCESPLDFLFDDLAQQHKITTDCCWPTDISSEPLVENKAENSKICYETLTQLRTLSSKNGDFKLVFSHFELFCYLKIFDFHIVGSSVLAKILGKNGFEKAFNQRGIPDILRLIPAENLAEIFHSNDIDFRIQVNQQPPEYYTNSILNYLIEKLPQKFSKFNLQNRKQIILENFITNFFKSSKDSPDAYATISFGDNDFFFWSKKLERKHLYHNDALRARCQFYSKGKFQLSFEGDLNGGWDTLLLQAMGILKIDKVEEINLQGVLSIFRHYTNGKRLLSPKLTHLFCERFMILFRTTHKTTFFQHLLKSAVNHFPNRQGGILVFALNMAFFLEDYITENKILPLLKDLLFHDDKALFPSDKQPELQLLNSIVKISTDNVCENDSIPGLPLLAFLQIFTNLRHHPKFAIYLREYGGRLAFQIQITAENRPLSLVVPDDFMTAIKKIKQFYVHRKDQSQTLEDLQKLSLYFFSTQQDETSLFHLEEVFGEKSRCQTADCDLDMQEMLNFDSPLFQQIGFTCLCQKGILAKSAIYFSLLARKLPLLLANEKLPQIRQQILRYFIQYALHSSSGNCFFACTNQIEKYYFYLGKPELKASDILLRFSYSFAGIDQIDIASAACIAWKKSCLIYFSSESSNAGKFLIEKLSPNYSIEFFKALKEICIQTQETFQKISPLFFRYCQNDVHDQETLQLQAESGQILLSRIKRPQEISADDRKNLINFSKNLLLHSHQKGWDFIDLLEKRALVLDVFKKIISDKSKDSLFVNQSQEKADLLLYWMEKSSVEHPLHTLSIKAMQERIELLIEGYHASLPKVTCNKLAFHIVQIFFAYDKKKFSPPPRLKEKLKEKAEWLYLNACDQLKKEGADSFHLAHCLLIKSMQRWDLCSFFQQEQFDQLSSDLAQLISERKNTEMVHGLLEMFSKGTAPLALLESVVALFLEEKNFERAVYYLQRIGNQINHLSPSIVNMILHCSVEVLKMQGAESAYSFLQNFLSKKSPFLHLEFIEHCKALLEILREKNSSTGIQFLIQLQPNSTDVDEFSPIAEQFILDQLNLHSPFAANISLNRKMSMSTIKIEQILLLIELYSINSTDIWPGLFQAFAPIQDKQLIINLILLFEKLSNSKKGLHSPEKIAYCWREFISATVPAERKNFHSIIKKKSELLSLIADLKDSTPLEKQDFFVSLLAAFLSLASTSVDIQKKIEIVNTCKAIEAILLTYKMPAKDLRIEWIHVLIHFSDFSSISKCWNFASQLINQYSHKQAWVKVNDLHSLLVNNFAQLKKYFTIKESCFFLKESTRIEQLLFNYVDNLFQIKDNADLLFPFFTLFLDLDSEPFLDKSFEIISKIFTASSIPRNEKFSSPTMLNKKEFSVSLPMLIDKLYLKNEQKFYLLLEVIEKNQLLAPEKLREWHAINLVRLLKEALDSSGNNKFMLNRVEDISALRRYEQDLKKIARGGEMTLHCHKSAATLLSSFLPFPYEAWGNLLKALVNLETHDFKLKFSLCLETIYKEWKRNFKTVAIIKTNETIDALYNTLVKISFTSSFQLTNSRTNIQGKDLHDFICALLDRLIDSKPADTQLRNATQGSIYFHLNLLLSLFPNSNEILEKILAVALLNGIPNLAPSELTGSLFLKYANQCQINKIMMPSIFSIRINFLLHQGVLADIRLPSQAMEMHNMIIFLNSKHTIECLYMALSIIREYQELLFDRPSHLIACYTSITKEILSQLERLECKEISVDERNSLELLWNTLWECAVQIEDEKVEIDLISSIISVGISCEVGRGPKGVFNLLEKIYNNYPFHHLLMDHCLKWLVALESHHYHKEKKAVKYSSLFRQLFFYSPSSARILNNPKSITNKEFSEVAIVENELSEQEFQRAKNALQENFQLHQINFSDSESFKSDNLQIEFVIETCYFKLCDKRVNSLANDRKKIHHFLTNELEQVENFFRIEGMDDIKARIKISLMRKLMFNGIDLDFEGREKYYLTLISIYSSENKSALYLITAVREWLDKLQNLGYGEEFTRILFSPSLQTLFFNAADLVIPYLDIYLKSLCSAQNLFKPVLPTEMQMPLFIATAVLNRDISEAVGDNEPNWKMFGHFLTHEKEISNKESIKGMTELFHQYFSFITFINLPREKSFVIYKNNSTYFPSILFEGLTRAHHCPHVFIENANFIHELIEEKRMQSDFSIFLLQMLQKIQFLPYMTAPGKFIDILRLYEILMPLIILQPSALQDQFITSLHRFYQVQKVNTKDFYNGHPLAIFFAKVLNAWISHCEKENNQYGFLIAEAFRYILTSDLLNSDHGLR